jgi:hypothetical protein
MNKFDAQLTEAFRRFVVIHQIANEDRPGSPPTREELIPAGIDKRSLSKLSSMGILKQEYLPIVRLGSSAVTTRAVYKLTDLGLRAAKALGFKR